MMHCYCINLLLVANVC